MPAANEPRGAKPGMIERNGGPNLSALGLADTMGKHGFIPRSVPDGLCFTPDLLLCAHLQLQ